MTPFPFPCPADASQTGPRGERLKECTHPSTPSLLCLKKCTHPQPPLYFVKRGLTTKSTSRFFIILKKVDKEMIHLHVSLLINDPLSRFPAPLTPVSRAPGGRGLKNVLTPNPLSTP